MIKVHHFHQRLHTSDGREIEIKGIEYPEQDEAIECLVPNKSLSVTFDVAKIDPETLAEFFRPCMEDLRVKFWIRAMAVITLFHFLRQSKRSRRRNRHLIKQLARRLRHPELGVAYILRKMESL